MNLVSMIMQFLAPAIINKMAGSLGMGQGLAGKAIAAALPAILAGLTGAASKSGGAAALAGVLGKQDPGLLGNFANMIGGSGQKSLTDGGLGALSSLLGGSSTNALAGAVGKFAGIDGNQSSSLLGMLAPVVMGQLAQTQKSSGLDAGGLANLLNGQKDNIAAAMPAGFSQLLEGTGLLDSVAGNLKSGASSAARTATSTATNTMSAAADEGFSLSKWIVPLALGVLGLYLLNSYGCNRGPDKVMAPDKPAASAPAAPAVKAPDAATAPAATPAPAAQAPATPPAPAAAIPDLGSLTAKALGALTTSLGGIKDEATAKAAVPGLTDIAKQLDGVKTAAALLSGDAKKPIATLVAAALPGITTAIQKAVAIPGVGETISPLLGPMVANLAALAK
jgi:Bacterial protein of unknown function (DUF937)